MFARSIAAGLLFLLLSADPALAGFVVSIGNATDVTPGSTVTLDVTVTGPDRLDLFAGEFILIPLDAASPADRVRFAVDALGDPPQPPLLESNYAFPTNNSYAYQNLPGNPGAVYETTWAGDSYLVSDSTLDQAGVDVSGGNLVARLTIQVDGSAPSGSRYGVVLGASSLYWDQFAADVPVTPVGGEITVAGAAVVPAPGGMTLAVIGGTTLLTGRWQRRRIARPSA
jgi:hypothetical protein